MLLFICYNNVGDYDGEEKNKKRNCKNVIEKQ